MISRSADSLWVRTILELSTKQYKNTILPSDPMNSLTSLFSIILSSKCPLMAKYVGTNGCRFVVIADVDAEDVAVEDLEVVDMAMVDDTIVGTVDIG